MECRPPRRLVKFLEDDSTSVPTVTTVPDFSDHPLGKIFCDDVSREIFSSVVCVTHK